MGIKGLITSIGNIIEILIPLSVGVAFLVFFWGLATYIYKSADVQGKDEGRNKMIWGLVALFVMVSVWGLVRFLQQELGIVKRENVEVTNPPGGGTTNPPGGNTGGGGNRPPCGPAPFFEFPCL